MTKNKRLEFRFLYGWLSDAVRPVHRSSNLQFKQNSDESCNSDLLSELPVRD